MRKLVIILALSLVSLASFAQEDKHDVREGNRLFRKNKFKESEISYRKARIKDSTSTTANYNLASSLYRQEDFQGAKTAIDKTVRDGCPAECNFNSGDVALQLKDYKTAVDAFRNYLLEHPEDLEAKENYIYAKLMLQNQQDQQNQQNQDNQDQNQDQDQNQNQDNQDQNQDQNNDDKSQDQEQPKISPQQAQQMLNAIQAREKETQEKVDKEKAQVLKSKQKEKNW